MKILRKEERVSYDSWEEMVSDSNTRIAEGQIQAEIDTKHQGANAAYQVLWIILNGVGF